MKCRMQRSTSQMGNPSSILDCIGKTPLVPLRRMAQGLRAPVLAKCEHMNPGGSVKDRIALAIVDDAERRGVLVPGGTLIEATAGWARSRGHDTLFLWVTESNAPARRLYERCGFTPTGETQPLPSNPNLLEIQMCRTLG